MLIQTGTKTTSLTEANSLVANLLKYPEISPVVLDIFGMYDSLASFTENLGRYATNVTYGADFVQWALQGRKSRPSIIDPTYAGNATAFVNNTAVVIPFTPGEMYLYPKAIVRFPGEVNAWVESINGFNVTFRPMTNNPAFPGINIPAGSMTLGIIGNMHEEGSPRGYGNQVFPDWYKNYLGIYRYEMEITGDALTDVLWIEFNGQRLHYPRQLANTLGLIEYERELTRWYADATVDAQGVRHQIDQVSGKGITHGDGLIPQIGLNNVDTYTGVLTEQQITNFIAMLKYNTGGAGEYVVWTGTAGRLAFEQAMKNFAPLIGAQFQYSGSDKNVHLGGNFTTYTGFGTKLVLAHNPIFDDPNIHGNDMISNQFGTYPRESYRMVFCDVSKQGSEGYNLELAVKAAGNVNRGRIIKYIPGMVDPHNPTNMYAATAEDKFKLEYLSHTGIILRNPFSCGMLVHA